MQKIVIGLFLSIGFSCTENGRQLKQVNAKLFQDTKSNDFFYNSNNELNTGEMSQTGKDLKPVLTKENNPVSDIDVSSFTDAQTFWYDKKYIFHIERHPGYKKVVAYERNDSTEYYFHNSYYRIANGKLEYFGKMMQSDGVINCPNQQVILDSVELEKFQVLEITNSEKYRSNSIAIYKDKYLLNGCWLAIEGMSATRKEQILNAKESHSFAERVAFNWKNR